MPQRTGNPLIDDEEQDYFGAQDEGDPDELELAGIPSAASLVSDDELTPLPPGADSDSGSQPTSKSAAQRYQDVLARSSSVYDRKKPNIWQTLGAGAIGGAAGWINSNPKGRPVDASKTIENILYPGQERREAQYGREVTAAGQAAKSEQDQTLTGARVGALGAQAEAAKKRGAYYDAQGKKGAMRVVPAGSTVVDESGKVLFSAPDKPGKEAPVHVVPAGSTVVDNAGTVLYSAPDKPDKPEPAAAAKQAFSKIVAKLSAEGLPPAAITDVNKLAGAIQHSATLLPEEKNTAMAYLAANPTPASTSTSGVIRMEVLGQTRQFPVINRKTGQVEMRNSNEINSDPGNFGPAGPGATAMSKQAIFEDLHLNINTARNAISALDSMDAGTRAQLSYALRHTDPGSAVQTFLAGAAATTMSPQQQEVVQALALLAENAMTLRSIGGMGAGSDDMRAAILATIPSGKSPSKAYAQGQLNKFEQVVNRLEGGVPKMTGAGIGTPHQGTPAQGGAVMMKAPNGQTKQVPADQVEHYKSMGAVVVTQ